MLAVSNIKISQATVEKNNALKTNNGTVLSFYTHPINMLLEMLSKWPLYFSHGPAALYQQRKAQDQVMY